MTFYTHKNKTQQGSPSKHAQPWNLWPKNILDVICYLQIIYFSTFFPYVLQSPSRAVRRTWAPEPRAACAWPGWWFRPRGTRSRRPAIAALEGNPCRRWFSVGGLVKQKRVKGVVWLRLGVLFVFLLLGEWPGAIPVQPVAIFRNPKQSPGIYIYI